MTLEAPGQEIREKNYALLTEMMGPNVRHVTIVINPEEEDDIEDTVAFLRLYIKMANQRKDNGVAYTKLGGKLDNSVEYGPQIRSLNEATPETPIILVKGPKSGAESTKVSVLGYGKIIIEGITYKDVSKAADLVNVTVLKMLCGSPDCADPALCATGGDCGC